MSEKEPKRINLRFKDGEENLVPELKDKLQMPDDTTTAMLILRAAAKKSTPELLAFIHDTNGVITQPLREIGETIVHQNRHIIQLLERSEHGE